MLWDNSLQELFFKGGFAMYPLLGCSVIVVAIALDRLVAFSSRRARYDEIVRRFQAPIARGDWDAVQHDLSGWRSPVARVLQVYLQHVKDPAELRDQAVSLEGSRQLARLEKRISWLSMLSGIATLLGLLGTVTGLVSAFHQIELQSGMVQPADLASGIWEALITTVFGLVIAIPSLAAYHYFDGCVSATGLRMQWIVMAAKGWIHQARAEPALNR